MGDGLLSLASPGICGMDNPLIDPVDQTVPAILKQLGIKPSRQLGQNFLADPVYLKKVVDAGEISKRDTVIEIGAGLGNLTRSLAQRAGEVIAFEIDPKFTSLLTSVADDCQNIRIFQADILKINLAEFIDSTNFMVVANIPYYITSKLIRHLLSLKERPKRLILTIQLEVAQRICAKDGKLSMLALSVQVYGAPRIISRIPAGAFFPTPKVDSAILRIDIFSKPRIKENQLNTFFKIANAGFSQRRKTLRNSLASGLEIDRLKIEKVLRNSGIDPHRRAETLSIEEWEILTRHYSDI